MDLPSIEKLAQQACFATDYSIKSKAQETFFGYCILITPDQLIALMNNGSQTLLFVLMEYIHKTLPRIKENHRNIFLAICSTVQRWYTNNATFIRQDQNPLQNYVENSVSRTIGQILKFLYSNTEQRDWTRDAVHEQSNPNFKLYLWKVFIESISNIDSCFTFLVYRSTVYSFQENIIPIIMDALLPYFQSVEDNIKINELSNMQSKLSVSQIQGIRDSSIQLFQPGQIKFTTLVFNLLKQVICFNYNITYSEFESESPIENCLVCFPDAVTKKVANIQFINSIFFVLQKLIIDQPKSSFLIITLECLQKIMLTKLFYSSNEVKKNFIKSMLQGMIRVLKIQSLNEETVQSLIQSNSKFLINIQLYQIREYDEEFQAWIGILKNIFIKVIKETPLSFDNSLLNECLELASKIVEEAVAPQLKDELHKFKAFGSDIVSIFLQSFFNPSDSNSLIGSTNKLRNYEDLKKTSSLFFKRVRNLVSVNLEATLNYLEPTLINVLQGSNVNAIANAYFLLPQLCDSLLFERNILFESQLQTNFPHFGKIIMISLEWIQKYRSYNQNIEIIEIGILFFIEKVVNECLNNFTYEKDMLKINAKLYKFIQMSRPDIKEQSFLTFGFNELARSLVNGDIQRVTYTFDILSTLLLKFKWGSKRQNFKQTTIAKNVLNLCQNLSQNNFEAQMLKLRKNLFKIIASISFDDILDDYRKNISDLVANLAKGLQQNRWKTLYDLTGICEAIDTATIYRYFLTSLNKNLPISDIMNQFFNNSMDNLQIIKAIMQLQLSMIENKGQRLSGVKNSFHNYKLISDLMPYWAEIVPQATTDQWDQILLQLYKIMRTLLRGNHVNFFLLERTVPSYKKYIRGMFQNMVVVCSWIQMYPGLFEQYLLILQLTAEHLMEVIFCSQDPELVRCFNKLLGIVMNLSLKQIDLLRDGNKKSEDVLDTTLTICKNVFKYLRIARNLTHKEIQIKNIGILEEDINIKFDYIIGLFKFGISFGKRQPRYLETISRIIHNMDFLSSAAIPTIVQKLGLDQSKSSELLEIWRRSDNDNEFADEFEDQGFLGQIKEWFKKCDTETLPDVEY